MIATCTGWIDWVGTISVMIISSVFIGFLLTRPRRR